MKEIYQDLWRLIANKALATRPFFLKPFIGSL
jgi:hypothetical protein